MQRRDGRGEIKRFADFPRTPHLTHLHLPVTAGHIQTGGIAPDIFMRFFQRNIAALFTNRHHQLYLIVIVIGLRWVRQFKDLTSCHRDYCISRFTEEERGFAIRIKAHFTRMSGIVTAHTVNAAHGKLFIAANHRNGNRRLWFEYILRHFLSPKLIACFAEQPQRFLNRSVRKTE